MSRLVDLTGRNAVVTGGSRGVGRAAALLLARGGASVGIGFHTRASEALDVVEAIRGFGVHGWAQQGDLANEGEADALFERADREFEGLDIFVGNAGIWPPEDVAVSRMGSDRWRRTLSVNLDAAFYTVRAAARRMRDGGSIVLVSSTAGQRGEAYHADYAATKGAIISMVKGIAGELAERDINVNAVAPGWVLTDMAADALADGGLERIAASIPLGRLATAEDVAGPIVFLCTPLARHITGEILNVNGGAVLVG